jgi:hypothetical protein
MRQDHWRIRIQYEGFQTFAIYITRIAPLTIRRVSSGSMYHSPTTRGHGS